MEWKASHDTREFLAGAPHATSLRYCQTDIAESAACIRAVHFRAWIVLDLAPSGPTDLRDNRRSAVLSLRENGQYVGARFTARPGNAICSRVRINIGGKLYSASFRRVFLKYTCILTFPFVHARVCVCVCFH